MMTWSRSIVMQKKVVKTKTGEVESDAYRALMGDQKAQVEMLVGTSIGFGDAKVHCTRMQRPSKPLDSSRT